MTNETKTAPFPNLRDVEERVNTWVQLAVKDWFRRQCQNPSARMHLYYKTGGGLWIGEEPLNDDWRDAGLRVLPSWTVETAATRVRDIARRLPILS